jgi:hypothetical protein
LRRHGSHRLTGCDQKAGHFAAPMISERERELG